MGQPEILILLDHNLRRRAAIAHCLVGTGVHVEPFEDLDELDRRWPRDGVILVFDEGSAIPRLVDRMAEVGAWLPIIAFAEAPPTHRVVEAVVRGAIDYLNWPFADGEIRTALTAAANGHALLESARLREAKARSRIQRLTPREREVLAGVASGLSNRLIGERLKISSRTVEIHRSNMLSKIGASHTSQAIRIAIEAALVD